ncbi:hypothetical protein [Streptomyces beihaiensis]|uniref:Uncharacterized protein n=1 Tax=Streptomyces beihaiensis TaxID=2984495 RepID=A0ABT3TWN3_9ACTN|nr:hypothetical protein [Streptomyces beihaiensis]MCX3060792.1 hypothetical protein [Streptomyces beihaiensis]
MKVKALLKSAGIAVPLAATLVAVPGAIGAHAAPGDNGDIKVHKITTKVSDQRNDPKVCRFYLDAFNFQPVRRVTWKIYQLPPTGRKEITHGTLRLRNGHGFTYPYSLPKGHYKVTWTWPGEHGSAKHKVFEVTCGRPPRPTPTPTPTPTPPGPTPKPTPKPTPTHGHGGHGHRYPTGGVNAGGGGMAAR